ncbi:DUF333 domain-containing protein [Bordetella muralis]|jgi:uncharacterized protein|uniref:putative hemolysin n=1 Tax=Bordetella muralis TaxID=1649130 RepID=UPI0039EF3A69
MKKIGIAAAALIAAGCSSPDRDPAPVGMANPASVYCAKLGGKLTIEDRQGGQVGMCTLPDGTTIEEWELYRRDHPRQ